MKDGRADVPFEEYDVKVIFEEDGMSDSAFKAGAFAGFTIEQLRAFSHDPLRAPQRPALEAEIARRKAVAAGDMSQATPSERLRAVKAGRAAQARYDEEWGTDNGFSPWDNQPSASEY